MGVAIGVELGLGSVLELGQIDFPIPFVGGEVGGGHNIQRGGQLK